MNKTRPKLGKIVLQNRKVCEEVVALLGTRIGIAMRPKRQGWGGYSGLIYKDVIFVVTYTQTKPPHERVVAWPTDNRSAWMPSESDRELVELCSFLKETTLPDLVFWHEFANMDYGLVYKDVQPRVVDATTCQAFGIDMTLCSAQGIEGEKLFWQEWGGKVFSALVQLDFDDKLIFQYKLLASHIGKYKGLPVHLRR